MRLRRFYIGSYRVLQNLDIRFHPDFMGSKDENSYAIDFLVGLNGSGKSTVLQALSEVIRRLERNAPVPFPFELEYDLGAEANRLQRIQISNRTQTEAGTEESTEMRTHVNGKDESFTQDLLPGLVLAFTTGNEEDWLEKRAALGGIEESSSTLQKLSSEERALRELPGHVKRLEEDSELPEEPSRFSLVRTTHLSLLTLCGFLEHISATGQGRLNALSNVLEQVGIQGVCGFSMKFRMNEGIITTAEKEEIQRLKKFSTRALRLGSDRLLVFDLTANAGQTARAILEEFVGGFEFFRIFSRMQRQLVPAENVLQEVNVFLNLNGEASGEEEAVTPPLHLLTWLSDGERSFLGRMSLFTILGQKEALILLDEPEVHFNDYWKRHIVNLLHLSMKNQWSHALITTHSSITLTDVPKGDIILLNRRGPFTDSADHPSVRTLAADPSDIMVHVFGTPYASGERAVSHILQELEAIGESKRPEQKKKLEQLLDEVSPGYWSYRIRQTLKRME